MGVRRHMHVRVCLRSGLQCIRSQAQRPEDPTQAGIGLSGGQRGGGGVHEGERPRMLGVGCAEVMVSSKRAWVPILVLGRLG